MAQQRSISDLVNGFIGLGKRAFGAGQNLESNSAGGVMTGTTEVKQNAGDITAYLNNAEQGEKKREARQPKQQKLPQFPTPPPMGKLYEKGILEDLRPGGPLRPHKLHPNSIRPPVAAPPIVGPPRSAAAAKRLADTTVAAGGAEKAAMGLGKLTMGALALYLGFKAVSAVIKLFSHDVRTSIEKFREVSAAHALAGQRLEATEFLASAEIGRRTGGSVGFAAEGAAARRESTVVFEAASENVLNTLAGIRDHVIAGMAIVLKAAPIIEPLLKWLGEDDDEAKMHPFLTHLENLASEDWDDTQVKKPGERKTSAAGSNAQHTGAGLIGSVPLYGQAINLLGNL